MEINLEKKHFALIAAFCLILTTGLVAANQETILRFANPAVDILPGRSVGHSSADVVVNFSDSPPCSGDISLQSAIDNKCFGTGGMAFGNMESKNFNQIYGPVATDGFVFVSTNWAYLDAYKGNSAATLTVVSKEAPASQGPQPSWGSITMPVKKGEYWKVDGRTDSTPIVYWIPLVEGSSGDSGTSLPPCSNNQLIQYNSTAEEWECADNCADEQILKYNLALDSWECTDESAGGGGDTDGSSDANPIFMNVNLNTDYQISETKGAYVYLYGKGDRTGYDIKLGPTSSPTVTIGNVMHNDESGTGTTTFATIYVPTGWYFRAEPTYGSPSITAYYVTID